MENVFDVCSFFVKEGIREGKLVSQISIQKLLYFAQGFHLALTDRPLFKEDIYAWSYGPVVKDVYHTYKFFGNNSIDRVAFELILPEHDLNSWRGIQDENIIQLLQKIWNALKQYSPFELVKITHANGSPWHEIHENYKGKIPKDIKIPHDRIIEYFTKTYIKETVQV